MFRFFFHKSPNTYKVAIFFEELGIPYESVFVDVSRGAQFSDDFVVLSPNSKVPVIVDTDPLGGGPPITIFESAAILLYLAEKTGALVPSDVGGRMAVVQWLIWHSASQSPMNGQAAHFNMFAPDCTYARNRYNREVRRLMQVLEKQLEAHEFVAGSTYSIADIACYPWLDAPKVALGFDTLEDYPNIDQWAQRIAERPAVRAAYDRLNRDETAHADLEVFARNMFGFDAEQARIAAENARGIIGRSGLSLKKD